jgi:hypothetical protein
MNESDSFPPVRARFGAVSTTAVVVVVVETVTVVVVVVEPKGRFVGSPFAHLSNSETDGPW